MEVKKVAPVLKSAPKKLPSEEAEEEHGEPEVSSLNIINLNEMYIRYIINYLLLYLLLWVLQFL